MGGKSKTEQGRLTLVRVDSAKAPSRSGGEPQVQATFSVA